jgi:signal transduction histidine kinase
MEGSDERTRAEDALDGAARAFDEGLTPFVSFLEEMPVAIFVITADGTPFYSNEAAKQLLGRGIETTAQITTLAEVYQAFVAGTDELYPHERMPLVRALSGMHTQIDDIEIAHPSGRIPLEVWGAPVHGPGGEIRYACAAFTDLSARRNAEAEAARALDREREAAHQLAELDQLRNDFVAMVAHDLRSPMTVVKGYADTMIGLWASISEEDKRDYLRRIVNATNTLAKLVDDVFEVSRIESGELRCHLQVFDLTQVIRQVVEERARSHADRSYPTQIEADLPLSIGDPQRQHQVLSNLLTNAAKFSPREEPIDVDARREGGYIRVSVRDRGDGIAPEEMGSLFKKFSRLESARTTKGSGLGLFICKSLVEAQGGTIEAHSDAGKGATFSYTVPIADP